MFDLKYFDNIRKLNEEAEKLKNNKGLIYNRLMIDHIKRNYNKTAREIAGDMYPTIETTFKTTIEEGLKSKKNK